MGMGDFLAQFSGALAAGLLVSTTCAFLGVFVLLKRVVFIGIALTEVAVCGMAAALLLGLPPAAGSIALTLGCVGLLARPFGKERLPRDAVLGFVFVLATSGAVLLVSHSGFGLMDVKALLYGDLILVSARDSLLLWLALPPVLAGGVVFLRPVLNTFLDREAAMVLGIRASRWESLFFLALGLTVAVASWSAGPGLVFCYLVVPPAAGLLLSRRLPIVLLSAAFFAAAATLLGLGISFRFDLPTNQTICVVACAGLVLLSPLRALLRG